MFFLRGLDGRDSLGEVIRRLYSITPSSRPYELLTGSLTQSFIQALAAKPDFLHLYICSPWIRLDDSLKRELSGAVADADRVYAGSVQLEVITRPPAVNPDSAWQQQLKDTLHFLTNLGATVYTNRRLHAKLFIRQPGPRGGLQSAVLGSENLTASNNIELGIWINNDNDILYKLQAWFREISWDSQSTGGL